MRKPLMVLPAVALFLVGCGGGEGDGGDRSAIDAANELSDQIDSISAVTEVTEDNDPNDLIGRPNGYDSAAVIEDDRAEGCEELAVDCGATIEQFESEDDAEERSDYIQGILDAGGSAFGTEYHYLDGALLLRVTGTLKPSDAEEYESAFTG